MTQANPSRALFIGIFLFLAAAACAVAPMPILFRSLGVVLFSYASFALAGSQMALFTALIAPVVGLLSGSEEWLVMLPIILASNLLGMLGLDFAWRYAALIVSPVLLSAPGVVSVLLSGQELFEVELPWQGEGVTWIGLHALVALLGVLGALLLDRSRRKRLAVAQAKLPEAA